MAMRDQGLVNQVFDEQKLRALQGDMAVGHVRYSTTGANSWENSQPVWRADRREVALAPQRQPRQRGRAARRAARGAASRSARRRTPRSSPRCSPRTRRTTIEDAVVDVMAALEGAYSTVVMTKDRVVAFRDPAGPAAAVARACSATATASRRRPARSTSSAPSFLRDVQPGEVVSLTARRASQTRQAVAVDARARCACSSTSTSRGPDSRLGGQVAAGRARADGRDPRRARRRSRPTS